MASALAKGSGNARILDRGVRGPRAQKTLCRLSFARFPQAIDRAEIDPAAGGVSRQLSMGQRFARPPSAWQARPPAASSAQASPTLHGRSYSNAAAFMRSPHAWRRP